MNIIFGAGGFAHEVGWLLHDLSRVDKGRYSLNGFVTIDDANNIGEAIQGVEVFAETKFFELYKDVDINAIIAVGPPRLKRNIQDKCSTFLNRVHFPPLIHPSVLMDTRPDAVHIGRGSIICAGSILTTGISIGEFVHINLGCTIGHDVAIGSYSTLSPGVHISGGVVMETSCFVGTGAVIIEQIRVTSETTIGAGATVVKNVNISGTYLGTPAVRR